MSDTATTDTIAAVATPPGRGGVAVLRVSGPKARWIAEAVLGSLPPARRAVLRAFRDGDDQPIDQGLALYFPGPASFTGEDVLELHCHGGPVVTGLLLARLTGLGARAAEPGEFSLRAFLNDRMDLVQAEALADLIDSGSAEAARAAVRSLSGEFSKRVNALTSAVTSLRVYVEAAIDFPEEEVDFLEEGAIGARLDELETQFDDLAASARQGRLLRDGMTVVIAGKPNAGKSSLLNRLAGYDAAIVTDIPGTTRDVLREHIQLDGLPLHVIDTAGLRDAGDAVEQEGMRRARDEMSRADRVLLIQDDTEASDAPGIDAHLPTGVPVTIVRNKIDLSGAAARVEDTAGGSNVWLSAKTGDGVDGLRKHLEACMGFVAPQGGVMTARQRHLDALDEARVHVTAARQWITDGKEGELVAEELRLAQGELGVITGTVTADDLLGEIFSSFCIGK